MEINQLTEVKAHKNPNCKWYRNNILDLTVEYALNGQIISFQLEFNERSHSYAINWDQFKLKNYVIDEGEEDPRKNQTPIVRSELVKPPTDLRSKFQQASLSLTAEIREFILGKI